MLCSAIGLQNVACNKLSQKLQNMYVVGQLSSQTRHRVLAVAALDQSLSMV